MLSLLKQSSALIQLCVGWPAPGPTLSAWVPASMYYRGGSEVLRV
jgi:hypothetical protein